MTEDERRVLMTLFFTLKAILIEKGIITARDEDSKKLDRCIEMFIEGEHK